MDQHKVPTASPGRSKKGSTLSIRVPVEMWERLDRARRQFSYPGAETLSISDVARLLLESGAKNINRLDYLVEIRDLLEQPTQTLLGMRRKWEDDEEFSRAEWDVLARYAEKGCEQHGFSSDSLPSCESFAQLLEAFLAVWSLRSGANPQQDSYYLANLGVPRSERSTLPEVVQRIIVDLRGQSSDTTRPLGPHEFPDVRLYAARNLKVALDQEQLEPGANVHRALRPFLPCLYRLAARGHWLAEKRSIRRKRPLGSAPDWLPTFVPDVTADDDFVLSTHVHPDEGELYMELRLNPLGISLSLGPYPHIREFMKMIAYLALPSPRPGDYWLGRYFKAGLAEDERISGESAFLFNGVRVWLTPSERVAVDSLFKQAMQLPQLQTTLAKLELEYGEV